MTTDEDSVQAKVAAACITASRDTGFRPEAVQLVLSACYAALERAREVAEETGRPASVGGEEVCRALLKTTNEYSIPIEDENARRVFGKVMRAAFRLTMAMNQPDAGYSLSVMRYKDRTLTIRDIW